LVLSSPPIEHGRSAALVAVFDLIPATWDLLSVKT